MSTDAQHEPNPLTMCLYTYNTTYCKIKQEMILKNVNFIPKQYDYVPTTIRIETEKLTLIDTAAAKHGLSRNEFVNQCIDFALSHMRTDEDYFSPGK